MKLFYRKVCYFSIDNYENYAPILQMYAIIPQKIMLLTIPQKIRLYYIRPTILRTYLYVICQSDELQVGYTLNYAQCTIFVAVAHFCRSNAHIFWSDAHFVQVGCTLCVGRVHTLCRSDAHFVQVECTNFLVGCTLCVGRVHTLCRSGAKQSVQLFFEKVCYYTTIRIIQGYQLRMRLS